MNQFNKIILESPPCVLCGESVSDILFSANDKLHGLPGVFNVVKCVSCGLIRTSPRPTITTIGFYYPENYGPFRSTLVKINSENRFLIKTLKLISSLVFKFNTNNTPSLVPGSMLEIGCASGSFLQRMASKGWDVHGLETSESAAKEASKLGYTIYAGSLESTELPLNCYDLIVGWMVIEHLHNPLLGLRKLHSAAKSQAMLVLSLPNAGSLEFSFFKSNWYALQVPTHIHHFSPDTITKLLSESGWRVDKIYHQRTLSNLIASYGYILKEKGFAFIGQKLIEYPENQGVWPYILYPISCIFAAFSQTGRMTVFASAIK